jgi:transaldolase
MKFFLDTAILAEIKQAKELGIVDGVTTNPTLIAKSGQDVVTVLKEIAALIDGPISGEVIATDVEGMLKEGRALSKLHPNIVVKLPLTQAGIKCCQVLTSESIKTNVTLCFSANQALLAAKAGATYVSPFLGRLDDMGQEGLGLIREIKTIFDHYKFSTQILAASIRHPEHIRLCALAGAHVATLPLKVLQQLYYHPLTDKGLEQFLKDHAQATK